MDLSLAGLAVVGLAIATRALARLYLGRLDRAERSGPAEKRVAITVSRRRAQGHLWAGGAIMATIALGAILFGANRPELGPKVALFAILLVAAGAFCARMATRAYREARSLRRQRPLPAAPSAQLRFRR